MLFKAVALSAMASLVAAQSAVLKFTTAYPVVTEGNATVYTWQTNDTVTPVTITLRKGASSNLQTVQVLTTSGQNGQYTWTPCTSLPDGTDYALEIQQKSQVNYYGPFTLTGYTGQGTCSGLVSSSTSSGSASPTGNSTSTSNSTHSTTSSAASTGSTSQGSSSASSTSSGSASSTSNPAGFQSAKPSSGATSAFVVGGSSVALLMGAVAAIVVA